MGLLSRGALVIIVVGIGAAGLLRFQQPAEPKKAPFEELRPGLFRHSLDVSPVPQVFHLPVSTWLLRGADQHSWILVDTGISLTSASFKAALKSKLTSPADKLKLILLTHGHSDHTEGLPWLLQDHPEALVAFHEKETRFITGKSQYAEVDGEHWSWNVVKHTLNVNSSQPTERCTTFTGDEGDVSTSLSSAIPDVSSWLPPDFLRYVHTPGHAPGHVSYIHKPTSSLIAGDVLFRITSSLRLQHPLSFLTPNMTLVKESQKRLAARSDIKTIFPTHDLGAGADISDLRVWIQRGYTS